MVRASASDRLVIGGETKLMGVLGENIAYTRSPAMHNRAAAALGIDIAYLPLAMPAAKVASFLDAAWSMGAVGFNVTTPHKGLVASLVPTSGLTSVNTLYRGDSGWLAASTDGEGFARGLGRLGRELSSFSRLVILGAGGAAGAIQEYVASNVGAAPEIVVLSRSSAKTPLTVTALTEQLRDRGADTLLIQATSAPQRGDDLAALVPALERFKGVVADLVYGKPSALYFAAIARNLTAQDGEAMLIEQARLSQMLWWGKSASYEEMALALRGK